jgi:hypothetical protein
MMAVSPNDKPPPPPGGGMEIDRPAEKKRAAEVDIGEMMKDAATAAARSRRQGELVTKEMRQQHMVEMQQAQLNHLQQQKEAEAEAARNRKRFTVDLQHERDVAVGALARGRQPPRPATTIAYRRPESTATIAYPQHFDIGSRSRSPMHHPLLPTFSARSVSSGSHSVGAHSDVMTVKKTKKVGLT